MIANERIQRQRLQACRTHTHMNTYAPPTEEQEQRGTQQKRYTEEEQRMQAIKGVSMFYARSCWINSGIIQAEWTYFALFCSRLFTTEMWFRFGFGFTTIPFVGFIRSFALRIARCVRARACSSTWNLLSIFTVSLSAYHFAWHGGFIELGRWDSKRNAYNSNNRAIGILE